MATYLAVLGVISLVLAPLAQGSEQCPDKAKAKDPTYLSCQVDAERVSCKPSKLLLETQCQDLVLYQKALPEYPKNQRRRGVQGWVLVGFTVTEQGEVVNPAVVNAQPPRVFDAAALAAVSLYKFHPLTMPLENIAIRIRFSLAE